MLCEHEAEFLLALKQDLNKCEQEAWLSELSFGQKGVDHAIKYLNKWCKPRKVSTPIIAQPGKSYQLPEPLGTVLIIGAWNYPIQLVLSPLVAAVAAGNCAVVKPSELSENCSKLLAKLFPRYLDIDCISIVEGGVEETTTLLKQKFDHIFYTGGEAVAKVVMHAVAENLTPVTLELGGKSPCIVDSNTNLDVTVARIVWSKWMNAGQTCVAPDYVLVEKTFVEPFLNALKAKLTEFYSSDAQGSNDYGRIINAKHFTRILNYLDGENVVYGGKFNTDTNYIEPTIVLASEHDIPDDGGKEPAEYIVKDSLTDIMKEEIFGPILLIQPVDNLDDAIRLINEKPKPLALYLYSRDKNFEEKVLKQTSDGNVGINDGFIFMANHNLPFGGVGLSGMGSYHGRAGFDTFSHLKTVMKRSFLFDIALRYPPFNSTKLKIFKKLL